MIGHSPDRSLRPLLEDALSPHLRAEDIRRLASDALVAYCDASAAELRDWIAPRLRPGESLFVAEFERWSAFGTAADRRWLLRRGH